MAAKPGGPMNPHDLESFKTALLEGDRRLVQRRRRRAATGAMGVLAAAILALVIALPSTPLEAPAIAAEAEQALLSHQGLVLHSEAEIVLPGGKLHQTISRWSLGDRSRSVSDDGTHVVESALDGKELRVRLELGGPIETVPNSIETPDPLLAYREVLEKASEVEEVTLDGVEAYRLEVPGRIRQVAYLRRSDRLPLKVEIEGGATTIYRVVEWLPESRAQLEIK
jgi:hypothetical protein